MLNSRTSQTILMIVAALLFIFMAIEMMRPGTLINRNKAAEDAPQHYGLAATLPQAPPESYHPVNLNDYVRSPYAGETIYTANYNPKDRCRVEYQLSGLMVLSQVMEVHHIEIIQAPGTPGGTTVKGGEGAYITPWPVNVRIVSNTTLDLVLMMEMVKPPKEWLKGTWSKDTRYTPEAVVVFQNCLPKSVSPTPTR